MKQEKQKKSGAEKKKRKKWKLLCHIENQELSQNFSFHTCSNFKSIYFASGSEGHCCLFIYLFIYWHFIFVSLVRIRIPMQVKQKASNRYVSEITQTIIICETFDYVIWWSTLIIKKLLSFLFSLDSVPDLLLPVFVIVLKGIKFFEQCTWPKADFFSFISSGFSQVLGQIGHLH